MKKLTLIIMLSLSLNNLLHAQNRAVPSLKIGDKVPQTALKGFLGKREAKDLKEFYKGKVLIINFWASWCVPCLKELPILDSLAKVNADKLNVISVTYESRDHTVSFLEKHPDLKLKSVAVLPGDSVLHQIFSHRIIPHNVWIDSSGTVRNITGSEGITQSNIDLLIEGKSSLTKNKNDAIGFNFNETFHKGDSNFISRSILTGYMEGIPGGLSYRRSWNPKKREIIRFFSFNVSLSHLLWSVVGMEKSIRNYYHLMRIETKDSTRYFWPSECPESFNRSKYKTKANWMKDNLYCYELTLPKPFQDTAFFDFMLNDLKRVFKFDIEKRREKILCTSIYVKESGLLKASKADTSYIQVNSDGLTAKRVSPVELFHYINEKVKPNLNSIPADPPFIDKTELKFPVDVALRFDNGRLPSYQEIKRMLEKRYGFSTKLEKHKYPITIIRDMEP